MSEKRIEKKFLLLDSTTEILVAETFFDTHGSVLRERLYAENGELESETENEYNEKRLLIREHIVDGEGNSVTNEFDFDNQGDLLETRMVFDDGTAQTTRYEKEGLLLSVTETDPDGELISRKEFDVDQDGRVLSERAFDEENQLVYRGAYAYDEKGRKKELVFNSNYMENSFRQIWEWDDKNRMISSEVLSPKGDLVSREYHVFEGDLLMYTEQRKNDTGKNVKITYRYATSVKPVQITETDFTGNILSDYYLEYNAQGHVIYQKTVTSSAYAGDYGAMGRSVNEFRIAIEY
jgi:hypothetical protein